MASSPAYVPKHRGTPAEPALKKGVKRGFLFSGIAVAATGIAVGGGIFLKAGKPGEEAQLAATGTVADPTSSPSAAGELDPIAGRTLAVSRSDRRAAVDPAKADLLAQESGGQVTKTEKLAAGDPRDIARAMLAEFGFSQSQFGCLDSLWDRESHWNPLAANRSSGAYGIPQALPGSKMGSAGSDWRTNPATQIRWGLGYIQARYGTPCGAWGHSQSHGWY
ncbi:MAG: lytic transglycosylase domain-containing protein [Nocardioidaceae bacterium]